MSTDVEPRTTRARIGLLAPEFRSTTIGMIALITLVAFEAMAVTTIMPTISRELDGASLYALAFAGPLAVGVVGMVVSGALADRGPIGRIVVVAAIVFTTGLVIVGTAPTMPVLVAGRLIQGLGGGGLTVVLYVLVARVYPARLHPPIFGAFAAAWVVPSLVGPVIAGAVAETVGWHWVFLGAVVLVLFSMSLLLPSLRSLARRLARPDEPRPSESRPDEASSIEQTAEQVAEPRPASATRGVAWRVVAAVVTAAAVLGLHLAAELPQPWTTILPPVALVIALAAVVPLVPRGTLLARRGLPAVIAARWLLGAAFFGAEIYLPYLLDVEYSFSPTLQGLALTGAGLAWGVASSLQGRLATAENARSTAILGSLLLAAGIAATLVVTVFGLHPAVAIAAWTVSGAGMGTVLPRLSVLMLEYSTPDDQGFNSSAAQIADSIGSSVALAFGAIVFAAVSSVWNTDADAAAPWLHAAPFAAVFLLALLFVAAAAAVAARVRR